jgi:transposase, IS30 family
MTYKHLTQDERYHIYEARLNKLTITEIARQLGRSKSTISREVKRNKGARGYRPAQAQSMADMRSLNCANAPRVPESTWCLVVEKLKLTWSPQQVSGRLALDGLACVSHESIYSYIYANKRAGGALYLALRAHKKYRKRHTGRERRGRIPNQVSIELRPEIVATRGRFGDWEADLVIGANHQQALVTMNERTSLYSLIAHVPSKCASVVAAAITSLATPFVGSFHTLTTDNGKEFTEHEAVAKALELDYYFAHPYCSWERGANENMNGLIREFFPKKSSFAGLTDEHVQRAMDKLNHRPRKCLNYRTPHEVFYEALHLNLSAVALRG